MKSEVQEYRATKSIDLVESCYYLTETEHKLLNLLASKMNSYDPAQSNRVSCTIQEFSLLTGTSSSQSARSLRKSLNELWKRELTWKVKGKSDHVCRWFQEMGVYTDGEISVVWSDKAMEGLANLQASKYVQLVNEHSMILKGGYAIRMFEIFCAERYIGNWDKKLGKYRFTLEVEDLMYRLDVPESYKKYRSFKPNVITRFIEELRDKEIAEIEYSERRVGRFIKELTFVVDWLI